MSAEGKKKRGESGVSNAKNIPFRYGGWNAQRGPIERWVYDGSTAIRNAVSKCGAGSRLVQACALAVAVDRGNHTPDFLSSPTLVKKLDAAMKRCSHPKLK